MKRTKLLNYLKDNGCEFFKEGANHTIFINRKTNNFSTIPRHNDIGDNLALKICRDLNVPKFKSH
jgi:hypothetical protein